MAQGLPQRARFLSFAVLAWIAAWATSISGCYRENPCRDPTNDGMCYCPVGASCQHSCNAAVPNCTLGCAQKNYDCAVACVDDCTAICTGAQTCDATCGERCSVSCEWVKQRCAAHVGPNSHVNCGGATDCDVRCEGPCDVSCTAGKCRVQCATPADCEIDCGGGVGPTSCPDGSRVCGRPC